MQSNIMDTINTLISIGKYADAERLFLQVLKKNKKSVPLLNGLAILYHVTLNNYPKALKYYKEALKCSKEIDTKSMINYNIGCLYMAMSNYTQAITYLDKSIKQGGVGEVEWNKCLSLLHNGDWVAGMQQYSTRYGQYRTAADAVRFPNIPLPYVSNMAEFKNRRVLVLNEQGFGDEIMFSRAFQHAKDSAKRVLIQCWPELLKTFQVSFPRVQFFIDRLFDIEFVNQFDCWSSTGDLFANLASAECEFAPVHRLKSSRVAEPTNDRKKIGICWSSNPKSVISQEKSLKFEELELFRTIEDAEIYAFQTNGVSIPSWMIDLSDKLKTFDDTAHHLEQMDLVISIDTAVAHLAGAMQKPTILVINDYLDWRWKYTDENKISKLYSTVKVMGKLELAEFLNSHQ